MLQFDLVPLPGERIPRDHGGRNWSNVAASQGMSRISRHCQKLGWGKEGFYPESLWPCWHVPRSASVGFCEYLELKAFFWWWIPVIWITLIYKHSTSIHLSIHPSIIHSSIHLFICLYIHSFISPSVHPSTYLYIIHPSRHPFIHLSIHPLSIHPLSPQIFLLSAFSVLVP